MLARCRLQNGTLGAASAAAPSVALARARPGRAQAFGLPRRAENCTIVRAQPADQTSALPASAPAPVTDAAVPDGHKGLHAELYGSDSESVHAAGRRYAFRDNEDDGSSLLPVPAYLASREGEAPLGVYAIADARRNLQFVGYSRNIVLAVKGHLARVGPELCAFVRPMVFANKAMATRAHMEAMAADWVEESGTVPPGNGVEAHLWAPAAAREDGPGVDASLLSPGERAAYEEKKLKLRKAMGESLLDDPDIDAAAADRRKRLMAAVQGDNWSSVVSEQTAETLQAAMEVGSGRLGGRQAGAPLLAVAAGGAAGTPESGAAGPASAGGSGVVSPFSRASVHRLVGEKHRLGGEGGSETGPPALTLEAVDVALDEVRPYLLADSGNVTVVSVEGGIVAVSLQGACSSCASSSQTLKMGIERQLKAVWGDAIQEVIQVDMGNGKPAASVEAIDLHLNMLRSAVANLGGAVEVASVGGGVAVLRFRGPPPIGKGLVAAIKDAFPDVREVVLQELPADALPVLVRAKGADAEAHGDMQLEPPREVPDREGNWPLSETDEKKCGETDPKGSPAEGSGVAEVPRTGRTSPQARDMRAAAVQQGGAPEGDRAIAGQAWQPTGDSPQTPEERYGSTEAYEQAMEDAKDRSRTSELGSGDQNANAPGGGLTGEGCSA